MVYESSAEIIRPEPEVKVRLTIEMSEVEARELLDLCARIGGDGRTTLRGVFSGRESSISHALENAGVKRSVVRMESYSAAYGGPAAPAETVYFKNRS
jgi:hypothetical protein